MSALVLFALIAKTRAWREVLHNTAGKVNFSQAEIELNESDRISVLC